MSGANNRSMELLLTHLVTRLGFTFGPMCPLGHLPLHGKVISRISCEVEQTAFIYNVVYQFNNEQKCETFRIGRTDPVQNYVCKRFNVMVFGESVDHLAMVDIDGIVVDGIKSMINQNDATVDFFQREVERNANERDITEKVSKVQVEKTISELVDVYKSTFVKGTADNVELPAVDVIVEMVSTLPIYQKIVTHGKYQNTLLSLTRVVEEGDSDYAIRLAYRHLVRAVLVICRFENYTVDAELGYSVA